MATPQNVLATAFGAYASDNEDSSDFENSKGTLDEGTATQLVQYDTDENDNEVEEGMSNSNGAMGKAREGTIEEEDTAEGTPQGSDTEPDGEPSAEYSGVDAEALSG
ncbi:hypothetical protein EC988_005472, partial [Linderina pennispora]